ncbi:hypothetical protein QTV44_003894 [Vibrio vulnificus]|nr:hypothetical protein [Vibrio vulnificus]
MSFEKISLSLVENPVNYINTLEFNRYKGLLAKDVILLVVSKNKKNISQLKKLIIDEEWREVIYCFDGRGGVGVLSYVKLFLGLKRRYSRLNFEYLVSGYYEHKVNVYLYQICKYRELILLDDGNMTIFTNKLRHVTKTISPLSISKRLTSKVGMLITALIVNYKKQYIEKVIYFTSKNLVVENGDEVIRNDYLDIKIRVLSKPTEKGTCYFLGAPLSDISITSLEREYEIIENALSLIKLKYDRIIYFPHRFESVKKIEGLLDKFGVVIADTDLPFELYLSSLSKSIPSCVAGFYTSTFSNIKYLAIEREIVLLSLIIPSNFILNHEKSKLIESIYSEYSVDSCIKLSSIYDDKW